MRNAQGGNPRRSNRTQTQQTKPFNSSAKRSVFNRIRLTCACVDCVIDATQGRFLCSQCGATLASTLDAVNRVMLDVCESEYLRDHGGDQ
jgi:ribosomal protein S27E